MFLFLLIIIIKNKIIIPLKSYIKFIIALKIDEIDNNYKNK